MEVAYLAARSRVTSLLSGCLASAPSTALQAVQGSPCTLLYFNLSHLSCHQAPHLLHHVPLALLDLGPHPPT
jgi:hypothetical protein